MITTFEEETGKLTVDELGLVPLIVRGFENHVGKENVISSGEICEKINFIVSKKFLTGVRLRKIIHHIVLNRMTKLPLIANSKGYYITRNQEEINAHATSLLDRMESIKARYNAVAYWRIP